MRESARPTEGSRSEESIRQVEIFARTLKFAEKPKIVCHNFQTLFLNDCARVRLAIAARTQLRRATHISDSHYLN